MNMGIAFPISFRRVMGTHWSYFVNDKNSKKKKKISVDEDQTIYGYKHCLKILLPTLYISVIFCFSASLLNRQGKHRRCLCLRKCILC
jgi:hypothetical protein